MYMQKQTEWGIKEGRLGLRVVLKENSKAKNRKRKRQIEIGKEDHPIHDVY